MMSEASVEVLLIPALIVSNLNHSHLELVADHTLLTAVSVFLSHSNGTE
jgi:hypothetical protein